MNKLWSLFLTLFLSLTAASCGMKLLPDLRIFPGPEQAAVSKTEAPQADSHKPKEGTDISESGGVAVPEAVSDVGTEPDSPISEAAVWETQADDHEFQEVDISEATASELKPGDPEKGSTAEERAADAVEADSNETDTPETTVSKEEADAEPAADKPKDTDASETETAAEALVAGEDEGTYQIRSGDILEIMTWKEPDFSKEIAVRIDGKITFPLLDDIQAAGRTPLELKREIAKRLKEYIKVPLVTVSVKSAQSQKFYILGEISKTGEYDLVKNLTVLQAFALSGGFTEWASKKEIILIRQEDGKEKVIRINYKNIAKGRDFSQNILIKADDTIIVP